MSLLDRYKCLLEKLQDSFKDITKKLQSFLKIGSESSFRIRRRQFLMGGCLALGISVFVYAVMKVLLNQGPVQSQEVIPKPETINITTATKQVDMSEARWNNLDGSINTLRQQVAEIAEAVYGVGHKFKANTPQINPVQNSEENIKSQQLSDDQSTSADAGLNDLSLNSEWQDNLQTSLETSLKEIRERLSSLEETEKHTQPQPSFTGQPNPYNPSQSGDEQNASSIQKHSLNLADSSKNLKNVETTIPAGAFAKTVLLSGLDASSAMNASSDPRPMLLRIIDHGTLPRRFQSDLKDCHCTAGAYGDLSSERVYARLEKLSCIDRFTGEIVELQVSGYVSGSDGKAGIRGVVASKDGQFLARSLMGGMFAGLSNVANPQNRRAQVNPFFGGGVAGAQPSGPSIGETFMSGMAGGATTALDRLSQYYIERAEQLQPVIQIAAGQVVDIVFTEGAPISAQYSVSTVQKKEEKGE